MTQILHLDVSPRSTRSHSRTLSKAFIDIWLRTHSGDHVVYRDIGQSPPPFVDQAWIAAAFTPPDARSQAMHEALQYSDVLVNELQAADVLVVGLPMYNFGVPAAFKAYIDQIVRIRRTFDFDPEDQIHPYKPRLHNKQMFIIVATGDSGYENAGRLAHLNHLDPHLRTVFGFIGITNISFVHVGNDEFGGEKQAHSLLTAHARIAELAAAPNQSATIA